MKITDVRCLLFESPVRFPSEVSKTTFDFGNTGVQTTLLLRVLTDEGIEGNCTETFPSAVDGGIVRYIENIVRPMIVGQDPLYRESIWQQIWWISRNTIPPQFLQGQVDVCLWDIAGKVANMPIYKLLGAYRDKVLAYASSQGGATPEAIAEEALAYKDMGYKAFKLHSYDAIAVDPRRDADDCAAVRKAVGDDISLMHDPFGKYNRQQALWLGRRLEELNFVWFEEPMREWDIEGYAQLCAALDIPILGPESVPGSIFTTPEFILRRAVDMVRSDITYKGGLGPVKKTASLAEAFGMNCEVHNSHSPLSNVANIHVIGSIKNCAFCEVMVPRTFSAGVIEDVQVDKEGYVHMPDKPGLGLELDWKSINAHKVYETPPLQQV